MGSAIDLFQMYEAAKNANLPWNGENPQLLFANARAEFKAENPNVSLQQAGYAVQALAGSPLVTGSLSQGTLQNASLGTMSPDQARQYYLDNPLPLDLTPPASPVNDKGTGETVNTISTTGKKAALIIGAGALLITGYLLLI